MSSVLLRPFRHADYRWYFGSQAISIIGTWMQTAAASWFVFQVTNSSKWPALVMVAEFLPGTLLGWLGGRLADRWPRRQLLALTQFGLLLVASILALTAHWGVLTPYLLVGLTLVAGLMNSVDGPTRVAYVKNLVGGEDLAPAVGLTALLVNLGRAVGPALAGAMLVYSGAAGCFAGNAASFAVVLLALSRIGNPGIPARTAPGAEGTPTGRNWTHRYPGLAGLMGVASLVSFCGWPFLSLLPALGDRIADDDPTLYARLVSAAGFGALLAVLLNAQVATPRGRRRATPISGVVMALGLLGLARASSGPAAVAAAGAVGLGLVLFQSTAQTTVQLAVSDSEQGKASGTLYSLLGLGVLLGNALLGPLADQVGPNHTLEFMGAVALIAALAQGLLVYRIPKLFDHG